MSKELRRELDQRGARVNNPPSPLRANTGNLQQGDNNTANTVFSQDPETLTTNPDTINFQSGSAVWFPDDLGTESNAYYVKFEVYLLDTENATQKVRGDSAVEVGFDKDGKPRFATNNKGLQGQTRNADPFGTPSMKRLHEIIALPMPDSVVTDHSTMWGRSEGGMASAVMALGDGVATDLKQGATNIAKTALLGVGTGISSLLSQLDLDGANTHLKLLTKRATNPRNEFLFDGVNNRSFNFQWKFIPKSAKEARTIRELLTKLKLYMYPELDQSTAGNYYLFPAMFDITFMRGSQENEWLYRTSTCALTNMIINYTGAGQWVSAGNEGAPVAFDVTCQFTEAEFLHRDRFKSESNPEGVAR